MTGDYAITDFEPEMIVGSNLRPWSCVIDLNDRAEFERRFSRYDIVEITRNGETRTFAPEEFFSALVKLAEKSQTCHMVRCYDEYRERKYQDIYECDQCGERVIRETCMHTSEPPRFCPGCGAEVTR